MAIPRWEDGMFPPLWACSFFKLFNRPNFEFPDNSISDTTFGQIFYQEQPPTNVLGSGLNANVSGRMIQVKAQIRFQAGSFLPNYMAV
jgi:hypothetical protein